MLYRKAKFLGWWRGCEELRIRGLREISGEIGLGLFSAGPAVSRFIQSTNSYIVELEVFQVKSNRCFVRLH